MPSQTESGKATDRGRKTEMCPAQRGRIISGSEFLFTGMKSVGENHLWERFLIRRDEMSIAEGLRVQSHNDGNQESPFEDDR